MRYLLVGLGLVLSATCLWAESRTVSYGSTTNVSTSANQACATTCSTAGCMVGFDVGILGVALPHMVACNNAAADECLCGGG